MKMRKSQVKLPRVSGGFSFMDLFKLEPSDEEKEILSRYVAPHNLNSRVVTNNDLLRVAEEAKILYTLCLLPHGQYPGAEAVAHPQIDDKDPLQLFVLKSKEIIINPVITNHTNVFIEKEEGCLSFPNEQMVKTERWNKITVQYQTLEKDGGLSDLIEENMNGLRSNVFQHEIQHLGLLGDENYIYKLTK